MQTEVYPVREAAQSRSVSDQSRISLPKHLLMMGIRATGLQSIKHTILIFFETGPMVDVLKHQGTTDRERDRLKMSVKTPANWFSCALSVRPGILPGPAALQIFCRDSSELTTWQPVVSSDKT